MKKEIEALINCKQGESMTLKINNFCTLKRWTKSGLGEVVDRFEVSFSLTHAYSHTYEIVSRDWRVIVEEVAKYQEMAFADAAAEFNKQLRNGYIG